VLIFAITFSTASRFSQFFAHIDTGNLEPEDIQLVYLTHLV